MGDLLPHYFPPKLQQLARVLDLVTGQRLFHVNDKVESLYFIQEGEVKAIRYLPDGGEVTMLRARRGEFLGESTLAIERYICDAIAINPAIAVSVPISSVKEALGVDASFAFQFLLEIAKTTRKQCSRYERLRLKSAPERIMHYLLCESGSDNVMQYPAHLYEWAHELGLQKETLYRTLAALERAGKIERTDRVIRLL